MGALTYVDDVPIICPSIRGMNKMLEICNTFAESNHIYFSTRKTICIKFGEEKKEHEKAIHKGKELTWADNVRHLSNFIFAVLKQI